MPFKSKAQIFGDNGPNGLAVPVSTSNSAGTASANRGIGFGEGVTAAIANRPSGALADNTDDLNTRLVAVEGDGLDGMYRSGGVAGAGRVITIDGGAVEVVSDDSDEDEARSLLRARLDNADGTEAAFEVVGAGSTFRHRVPVGFNSQTVLSASGVAGILNPGGAGAGRVQVSGGNRFSNSGLSEILFGNDFAVITDAGALNGVYRIDSSVSNQVVELLNLDGSSPGFTSSAACTVTIFRPVAELVDGLGLLMSPSPGDNTGLTVKFKTNPTTAPIRYFAVDSNGTVHGVLAIGANGDIKIQDDRGISGADVRKRALLELDSDVQQADSRTVIVERMLPTLHILDGGTYQHSRNVAFIRGFEEVAPMTSPGGGSQPYPITVTLGSGGECTFSSDNTAQLGDFRLGTIVRLSNTAAGAYDGYYMTLLVSNSGNGKIYIYDFNGSPPGFSSGSATLHRVENLHTVLGGYDGISLSADSSNSYGKIFYPGSGNVAPKHFSNGTYLHNGEFHIADQGTYQSGNAHAHDFVFAQYGGTTRMRRAQITPSSGGIVRVVNRVFYQGAWEIDPGLYRWMASANSDSIVFAFQPPHAIKNVNSIVARVVADSSQVTPADRLQMFAQRWDDGTLIDLWSASQTTTASSGSQDIGGALTTPCDLDPDQVIFITVVSSASGNTSGSGDVVRSIRLTYDADVIGASA